VIEFAHPWTLAALAAPALLALWRAAALRRGADAVELPGLPPASLSLRARLASAPALLSIAGMAAAVVALAGPRRIERRSIDANAGLDIAIALDVSGSMAAEDFHPRNRLEVAKSVVADFLRRRPDDSIALVTFAGSAQTLCPVTTDHAALLGLLAQADGSRLPDGTAIGNAIATAVSRLKDLPGRGRVIVLVTDGGNNAGQIDPETAASLARAYDIRIHTVGVGRGGRVSIPVTSRDPESGRIVRRRIQAEVEIDEGLLRRIAESTGGRFFRATERAALEEIFRQIDTREKSARPPKVLLTATDLSWAPTAAAAALLAAGLLLSSGPLRVETEVG
jgi:Ca-activated chloride channel homolog